MAANKTALWTKFFNLDAPVGWISENTYCMLFCMINQKIYFYSILMMSSST